MKCKRYKSCKKVPCGCSKPTCPPEYCYNTKQNKKNKATTSKNWTNCNMIFAYNDKNPHHIKTCKKFLKKYKQKNLNKSKKIHTKNSVNAKTLHQKMPYLWRFLKPKTRKHLVDLAKKPIHLINIPFHVFENLNKKTQKKHIKKQRQLKKKYKDI